MTAHTPEAGMKRLVSKVVESTRCTPGEAEHVLRENANDPNLAALAILERLEERETWKESKSKKTKKQDVVVNEIEESRERRQNRGRGRDNQHNLRSQRGSDSQRDGGGGVRAGAGQWPSGEGRRDKGPHHFDGHTNRGAVGGEKTGRGGGGGYKGARDGGRSQQYNGGGTYRSSRRMEKNDNMSMDPVTNEHGETPKEENSDNVWKNGPLVFEASAPCEISTPIQEVAPAVAPTPKKDGKLSFAEVAKTKPKVVSAPPPPPVKRAAVPTAGSTPQEQQMRKAEDQKAAASTDDEYITKDSAAPTVFGASGTALNINKEFTDDLKVIGLVSLNSAGAHAEQTNQSGGPGSIGPVPSNPLPTTEMASVEFVTGGVPPSGLGFQFEFGQFNDAPNAPTANHHDPSSMHYTTQHKSPHGGANMVTSSNSNPLDRSQANVQQAPPSLDQFDHSAPQRNNTAGARGTGAAPSSQQPPQQHLQFQAPTTQHSQQPQQHQQQQPQQQHTMFAAAQFPSYNYQPYQAMYSSMLSPLSADMRNTTADQFSAATAAALAMPFPPGAFGLNGMGQMGDPLGLMLPPNLSAPPQQQQQQPQAQSGQQSGAVGTTGGTPPTQNSRPAQNQLQQAPQQSRPQAGGGIDHHSSYIDSVNKTYQAQSGNLGQPNSSTNQTGSFPAMGLVVTQSSYQQPRPNMNTHGNMEQQNHLGGNTAGPPPGFGNIPSNMNPFMQPANFQSLFQLPPNNSYPQQMAALPLLFGHGGGQQGAGGGQPGNKYGGGGSLGGGMGGGKGGGAGQQSHYQNSLYGGGQKKQNYSGWN